MKRRYALFLGCTIPVRGLNYEMSARRVAEELGIELVDIDGFACCGFPAKPLDREAGLLMAARNLALAEAQGLDILTLCSACTGTLTEANHQLRDDADLRDWVNRQLADLARADSAGSPGDCVDPPAYRGEVRVRHFARVLYEDIGVETLRARVAASGDAGPHDAGPHDAGHHDAGHPLEDYGFAAHYGCHYLKPAHLYDGFDDPEHPQSLERLIEATGARVVHYEDEGQCCGGGILGFDQEAALLVAKGKLDHVTAAGADAMVLICPFCAIMYEANQRRVERQYGVTYRLPVLYYPQILGLAMGFSGEAMGLGLNRVKPRRLMETLRAWKNVNPKDSTV